MECEAVIQLGMGAVFHDVREGIPGALCLEEALFLICLLMKKVAMLLTSPSQKNRKGFSTMMYNSECSEKKIM